MDIGLFNSYLGFCFYYLNGVNDIKINHVP